MERFQVSRPGSCVGDWAIDGLLGFEVNDLAVD